jgi:hypothetical protein
VPIPGDQVAAGALFRSTGSWKDPTGVTAVMTGVVMSLETGISIPKTCPEEITNAPALQSSTVDVPASPPDVELHQDAWDKFGDEAVVAVRAVVSEPIEFNLHELDAPDDGSALSGVGELIDFDPHNPGEHPTIGGIYVLYDISERPLYVGQGKSIDKRIRDHHDKFWFRSPIVESALYVQIDDKKLRESVEAVLIKFLKSNAVINKKLVDR